MMNRAGDKMMKFDAFLSLRSHISFRLQNRSIITHPTKDPKEKTEPPSFDISLTGPVNKVNTK